MSDFARVDSIDSLREFRAAVVKFTEVAKVALGDAESDIQRTINWLDLEMSSHWDAQVRKRQQAVTDAAAKLREKRLFLDATGKPPSTVDEEKILKKAQQRLVQAEEKQAAVRKYSRAMLKLQHDYKGSVQGFTTAVAHDLPLAIARLDRLSSLLRQYVELSAGAGDEVGTAPAAGTGGMARAADSAAPNEPIAPADELPDFPKFDPPQVVLVHTHRPTGLVLTAEGKGPADDGNQYRRFVSQAEAEQYAKRKVEAEPLIECAIYGADRTRLTTIAKEPAAT
ncbi:MAG TPA: hypothetical protein VF796_13735 [Humisphaera sp.]